MSTINVGGIDVPLTAFSEAFGQSNEAAPATTGAASPSLAAEAPSVTATVDADPGILGTIADVGKGLLGGAGDAINENLDLAHSAVNWVDDKLGTDVVPDKNPVRLPEISENVTAFGRLTRSVSQFATGFVGAGKLLKAANVLQGAGRATSLARGMAQGALTDFAAFDPHEERLSNLIEEYPELVNPVTRFLAAKPGDGEAEGRFKNALEGLALGAAVDTILHGVKTIKALRSAKSGVEAERVLAEASDMLAPAVKDTDEAVAKAITDDALKIRGITASADDAAPALSKEAASDASLEMVTKEVVSEAPAREFKGDLTDKQFKDIIDRSKTIDEVVEHGADSINLRRTVFESPDPTNVMRLVSDALYDKTLKGAGPESHKVILKDSVEWVEKAGVKVDDLIAHAQTDAAALEDISRRLYAARATLGMMTKESVRLGTVLDTGRATVKDMAMFHALHRDVQDLHIAVADVRTGSGRLLSSQKMLVDTTSDLAHADLKTAGSGAKEAAVKEGAAESAAKPKVTLGDIEKMTEAEAASYLTSQGVNAKQLKQLARYIRMADGDPFAVSRMMNQAFTGSWWGVHHEYWMNSILSGYRTMGTNLMGNTLKAFVMPGEKILGGLMTNNKTLMSEGARTYMGMMKFLTDSAQIAWKSFKADNNILDAGAAVIDGPTHQITFENLKNLMLSRRLNTTDPKALAEATLTPWEEVVARGFGWMGKYLRLPSRVLMASDELFKQLNFRADLYSRLHTVAVERLGTDAAPEAISSFVEREMGKFFENGGRAVDFEAQAKGIAAQFGGQLPDAVKAELSSYNDMSTKALRYAQEATWTQPLQYGIGASLQRMAVEHPSVRMVVPFIRTPTNILRDFVAHTPGLAHLSRRYKEAIAAGGEAAAMAQGQLATGSMLWTTAVGLAASGAITGAPPKDPKLKARLEETGWQPWSLKVGDKYISYRRLDPVGMFLGMAADYTRLWQDSATMQQSEIATGMIVALANNLTSKTYLQGITEVVGAITNPDENMDKLLKQRAASYIPMSSLLRNIRQDMTDPHMREVRSLLDYAMNTVPGWSDSLPAKRSWVTGKPQDYVSVGQEANDPVLSELNRLADTILGAPQRKIRGGVELTPEQYSRLNELHGTVKIGGKTMHERLGDLFASERYDVRRERVDDPPIGMEGPRAEAVNKVIRAYRKAATDQLLREDRALVMDVEKARRTAKLAEKGRLTKTNEAQMNTLLGY